MSMQLKLLHSNLFPVLQYYLALIVFSWQPDQLLQCWLTQGKGLFPPREGQHLLQSSINIWQLTTSITSHSSVLMLIVTACSTSFEMLLDALLKFLDFFYFIFFWGGELKNLTLSRFQGEAITHWWSWQTCFSRWSWFTLLALRNHKKDNETSDEDSKKRGLGATLCLYLSISMVVFCICLLFELGCFFENDSLALLLIQVVLLCLEIP